MENFKEVWRPVVGYEGLYEVSNLGNVDVLNFRQSGLRRRMKKHLNIDGYEVITFYKNGNRNGFGVHRLVAMAFIPNPYNLPQVNHKDEDKLNNFVYVNEDGSVDLEKSNLEWCDSKYNCNYGTRVKRRLETMSNPIIQMTLEGVPIKKYKSIKEATIETGLKSSSISVACSGKKITAGGYKWRYEDEKRNEKALNLREKIVKDYTKKGYPYNRSNKRKVVQFTPNGVFVKEYSSAKECADNLSLHVSYIRRVCNSGKLVRGYIFKYKEDVK